jgi:hypothetical protein
MNEYKWTWLNTRKDETIKFWAFHWKPKTIIDLPNFLSSTISSSFLNIVIELYFAALQKKARKVKIEIIKMYFVAKYMSSQNY